MAERTKKQMAAHQRRTLKSIKAKLIDMSCEWDGVDQYSMNSLNELAEKVQETADFLLDKEAA